MMRSVNTLDLPHAAKQKLMELGYEYCEDLEKALLHPESIPEAVRSVVYEYNVTGVLKSGKSCAIFTAVDFWNAECCNPPVSLFHKGLDKLLRGGFPVGRVTEICGPPGTGKTQICIQAAIDVQIPAELGGSAREALFVSTDFGLKLRRLRQMALESVRHVAGICGGSEEQRRFTIESVLSGVNVVRVCGVRELHDTIRHLETYIKTNLKLKLVIIDSFSLPLVAEVSDLLERTRLVHVMFDKLVEVAFRFGVAVVLTNQLTTMVSGNSEKKLIPSLGQGFGHRLHKRILLDEGKACLTKSIDQPKLFAEFKITADGVR